MSFRKAPQERATPHVIDHEGWEKIRLHADDDSVDIEHKIGDYFTGLRIEGRGGVENLRDFCNAWLENNGEPGDS